MIGFGGSLFLIALGAVLRYAVTAELAGIDIGTVGLILMFAGLASLTITLFFLLRTRRDVRGGPPPPY